MNINRNKKNSLLQLILIFGIVFSAANSLSALAETNQNNNNQQPVTDKQLKKLQDDLTKSFNQKIDSSTKEIKKIQNTINNSDNLFSKKNSLLFIDLPILIILLLLWFLNIKKQQQQIDKIIYNQNKLIGNFNQFNEINNKLNNLDKINRQIIEKIQDSNQKNIDSEVRLRELMTKQQFNQPVNYHNSSTLDIFNSNLNTIVDKVSQLIETYNYDKNSLSGTEIATVTETEESIAQRRSGNNNKVTLGNTSQKKYWIVRENNEYYLIPHAKIKIDEFNIKTLESLFDCSNFNFEYNNFQLVQPAKVSQLSSETWQLEEKGKLEFF